MEAKVEPDYVEILNLEMEWWILTEFNTETVLVFVKYIINLPVMIVANSFHDSQTQPVPFAAARRIVKPMEQIIFIQAAVGGFVVYDEERIVPFDMYRFVRHIVAKRVYYQVVNHGLQ